MKKLLRHRALVAAGIAAAMAFTSCAYDPYYSSVGGSYSTGYGDGYGYGGSNFNTSVFVATGNPRWGYDPYCYSYYDYNRRCYYDPYLNGYYPVGYRPAVVVGCPHPYGWSPGRGYCPPPSYVRNTTVVNYRNRESAYRNTNYDWAKQVRQKPVYGRQQESHPQRGGNTYNRPTDSRPSNNSNYNQQRREESRNPSQHGTRSQQQGSRTNGRVPSNYNTPVTRTANRQVNPSRQPSTNQRTESRSRQAPQPAYQGRKQQAPPPRQGGNSGRSEESRPSKQQQNRNIRSLGQG